MIKENDMKGIRFVLTMIIARKSMGKTTIKSKIKATKNVEAAISKGNPNRVFKR